MNKQQVATINSAIKYIQDFKHPNGIVKFNDTYGVWNGVETYISKELGKNGLQQACEIICKHFVDKVIPCLNNLLDLESEVFEFSKSNVYLKGSEFGNIKIYIPEGLSENVLFSYSYHLLDRMLNFYKAKRVFIVNNNGIKVALVFNRDNTISSDYGVLMPRRFNYYDGYDCIQI